MTERGPSGSVDADRRLSRRSFLAVASAGAAAAVPFVREAGKEDRDGRTTGTDGFDPTRHGFGFHNWRIQQGPYPGVEGSDPEREFVELWDAPFQRAFDSPLTSMPGRLREALAEHAREGLLEAMRTNGYCYGMVFAASSTSNGRKRSPVGSNTRARSNTRRRRSRPRKRRCSTTLWTTTALSTSTSTPGSVGTG